MFEMSNEVKKCLTIFLIACGIALSIPSKMIMVYFGGLILFLLILLINVNIFFNTKIYLRSIIFLFGSYIVLSTDSSAINELNDNIWWLRIKESWIVICVIIIYNVYTFLWNYKKVPNKCSWGKRNLFSKRKADLIRLKKLVEDSSVTSIGVEAEWGQGKSFVVDGLIEELISQNNYEIIRIDVMAIRLDKFAEYLIQELNDILVKYDIISGNMHKLTKIFQNINVKGASVIWSDANTQYAKIFDSFRKELLSLNRNILIIYEDLDRICNADAIRNIFYLSEKLTESNSVITNGGIKIIYQYNRMYMKELGFSEEYLEKYIRRHMDLTPLLLGDMIRAIQDEKKLEFKLSDEEIINLPFADGFLSKQIFPNEENMIRNYMAEKYTVRKTIDFLDAIQRGMSYVDEKIDYERRLVVAFYFIQYFLPLAYSQLKKVEVVSLNQVMVIKNDKEEDVNLIEVFKKYQMLRKNANIRKGLEYKRCNNERKLKFFLGTFCDIIDYKKRSEQFEIYLAFRVLGLDDVTLPKDDRMEMKEYYRYNNKHFEDVVGLRYIRIERIVKFLLNAGSARWDSYQYWGNELSKALSELNDNNAVAIYEDYLNKMKVDKFCMGNILRMGIKETWPALFRSFYIASQKWDEKKRVNNYEQLINLYNSIDAHFTKSKDLVFNIKFIKDTLLLWEGIQDRNVLLMLSDLVTNRKVKQRINDSELLYIYIRESLKTIRNMGYITELNLRELIKVENEPSQEKRICSWKELTIKELRNINDDLKKKLLYLHNNRKCLQSEVNSYEYLIKLTKYYLDAINYSSKTICSVDDMSALLSERNIIEEDVIEKRRIRSITNDDEFYNTINDINSKLSIAERIEIAMQRNNNER